MQINTQNQINPIYNFYDNHYFLEYINPDQSPVEVSFKASLWTPLYLMRLLKLHA